MLCIIFQKLLNQEKAGKSKEDRSKDVQVEDVQVDTQLVRITLKMRQKAMMCQNNIFTEKKPREIYSTEDQITQEIFDDDLHEDIQATELVTQANN